MADYLRGDLTELYFAGHLIGECENFAIDDPILEIEEVDLLGTEHTQYIRIRKNITGTMGGIICDWEKLCLTLGHVYFDTGESPPVEDFITQDGDFNQKIVLGQVTGTGTGKKVFNDVGGGNESKLSQSFIARAKTIDKVWLKLTKNAGTPDTTIKVRVYGDNAGHSGPSTTMYAYSSSLSTDDLSNSPTYTWESFAVTMDATNDELTVGSKYWLTCEFDDNTGDDGSTDFIRWQCAGSDAYNLTTSRYGVTSTLLSEYSDSDWSRDSTDDTAFIITFLAKIGTEKGFELVIYQYDNNGNSKVKMKLEGVRFYSGELDIGATSLIRNNLSWRAKSIVITKD